MAANGSPWSRIIPIESCREVVIDYQQGSNGYNVQITTLNLMGEQVKHVGVLQDINDLSPLQSKIHEITYNQCFSGFTSLELISQCDENTMSDSKPEVSSDYLSLIESIIKKLPPLEDSCKEIITLLELQEQIPDMDQDLRLKFDNKLHIFKLAKYFDLADDSMDEIIDHYYACGGKRKTSELVRNLILLEAKNACVMSPPDGALELKEVLDIANNVSKNYNNKTLLDLKSVQNKITKQAVHSFIDKMLEKQVRSLLGDNYPAAPIVSKLKSKHPFDKIKDDDLMEYTKYVFTQNIPIEFIEEMIPKIADKNFKQILPENLSSEQKDQFMSEEVIPELSSTWNRCIQEFKDTILFEEKDKKKIIKHRKNSEKNFCKVNPQVCHLNGCAQVKNFGTMRPDIKDMNMVQACLFRGINNTVPIVIGKIIEAQVDGLSGSIPFTKESTSELQRETELSFKTCTEKNFTKEALKTHTNFSEPLYHVSSERYPQIIASCAKDVEKKLTTNFAIMTVAKTAAVENNFKDQENSQYYSVPFKAGAISFAESSIHESIKLCEEAQLKRSHYTDISYPICLHVIEIKASHAVVESKLEETMDGVNVDKEVQREILDEFRTCVDQEAKSAANKIGSGIKNSNDSKEYLEKNHELLNCVKKVIPQTVDIVAKKTLDNQEKEIESKVTNLSVFSNMKDRLKDKVVSCFEKRLSNISSWKQFLKLNDNNFIAETQADCTHKTTSLALSEILPGEIEHRIKEFKRGGIVTLTTSELAESLNPIKDTKTTNSLEDIIKAHYFHYIGANPKADTTSYTNAFTAEVQDTVVRNIYDQLFKMRTPQSIEDSDLQMLKDALPKQCVAELYKIHQKAFSSEDSGKEKEEKREKSTGLIEIQKILTMGVENAKGTKTFDSLTKTLRNICKDPNKYKDLDDIIDSGVANPWVIAYTWSEVQSNLKKAMIDQCFDTFKNEDDSYPAYVNQKLLSVICSDPQNLTENEIKKLISKEKNTENIHNKYLMSFIRLQNELENIEQNISLKDFNNYFSEHEDFLEYTYDNLDEVSSPEVKTGIIRRIVDPIFQSKIFEKFSTNFTINQVTTGVAISGLSQAQTAVKKELDQLSFPKRLIAETIVRSSKAALKETWNYENIKSYLGWNIIAPEKRDLIKSELYELNVIPRLKIANLPEGEEKEKEIEKAKQQSAKFVEMIEDYVNNERIHKNDKADKKASLYGTPIRIHPDEPDYYTFIDMVTNEITRNATAKVKEKTKDKIKESLIPDFMKDE